MSALRRCGLTLATACLSLAALAAAASAATFTVNTTADTSDPGGCTSASVCSLRDAVTAANAAPGSTINVPSGHYTLNTGATLLGPLAPTAAMTIVGADARSTIIDGNAKDRVFDFEPSDRATVLELENLTVTNGSAPIPAPMGATDPGDGGGIFSLGGLVLQGVAVTDNTAAASGAGVTDGLFDNSPSPGPATFNDVTIAGNRVEGGAGSGQGGGALVVTTLTMTNSTVANNASTNPGVNLGGGLVSNDDNTAPAAATATLVNDTITGNFVSQPVAMPAGDQGGGVSGYANPIPIFRSRIDAVNTIVANNKADGAEQDCALLESSGTSSHSIQGDSSCGFTDSTSRTTASVGLGSLKDNGGQTDTELPSGTSPAVNAGTNAGCPPADERGVKRPQGPACDVGAVELAPPSAVTGPASSIKPASALASGTASNPAVLDGSTTIQWGTSKLYGKTASAGVAQAGSLGVKHTTKLRRLAPRTTYHYRIVVSTSDGTAYGVDRTFHTPRSPTTTTVKCTPAKAAAGHTTSCTVTVKSARGVTLDPTGSVQFKAGAGRFAGSARCELRGPRGRGVSHCTVVYAPSATAASAKVTAAYGGDRSHRASRGTTRVSARRGRGAPGDD